MGDSLLIASFLALTDTDAFVKKLTAAISTKSYLPSEPEPASASSATDASAARSSKPSLKRPAEDEAPRQPPKAPRAHVHDEVAGSRREGVNGSGERRSTDERERDATERHREGSTVDRSGSDGAQTHHNKSRNKCRDFHGECPQLVSVSKTRAHQFTVTNLPLTHVTEKGWCSRGEKCRFEHSTDAIRGGLPFGNRMNNGMGQQPQMGHMPPHMQFGPNQGGPHGFAGSPPPMMMFQGPGANAPPGWAPSQAGSPFQQNPQAQGFPPNAPQGFNSNSLAQRLGEQPPPTFTNLTSDDVSSSSSSETASRGGFAGRGRGRGGGPAGVFQQRNRSTTTLVIENVPAESLDLIQINDYFRRFGTITNIQIDAPSSKALVSYASPAEAKAAHESPDVIFGNRFVKVYFQKLDDGGDKGASHGGRTHHQPTQKQSFNPGENVYRAPGAAAASSSSSQPQGPSSEQIAERQEAVQAQKHAQDELNRLMTEQKQLLVKVGSTATSTEDKKGGMKKLRELEPTIKEATETFKKAVAAVAALPALPAGMPQNDPAKRQEQKEKAEKERLDRELEAHSKSNVPGSQTEELRAKVAALKAEAASMGIQQDSAEDGHSSRGGYRGRGGRGSYRGSSRGGWTGGGAMRLDNRTTRLNVTNIPAETEVQKVKEWLQSFGEVANFEDSKPDSKEFLVNFKHRQSGEQAVRAALSEVPNVGKVTLIWAPNDKGSPAAPPATTTESSTSNGNEAAAGGATGPEGATGEEENWKR